MNSMSQIYLLVRLNSGYQFLPTTFMSDSDSSASTMIVALVAIIVIAALGFLMYKTINGKTDDSGTEINVTIPEMGSSNR